MLFIAKGFLTPTISYNNEIVFDKSVEEAWAVMNDESKISLWLEGIINIEHVSGKRGEVGGVTKYTFDEEGEKSIVVETIKSISLNEHIAIDFVMGGVMNMDYRVDLSEQDGSTQIKSSTITNGSGFFMRSMLSFMKDAIQNQEDENMSKLKNLIEENTTNYFSSPIEQTFEIELG